MSEFPEILTLEQAAAFLQVSTRTIQRMVKRSEMPGRRVGGQWRFDRDQLREWVRGKDLPAAAPAPSSQLDLIAREARWVGADLPQMLIDLQQEACRRLAESEEGRRDGPDGSDDAGVPDDRDDPDQQDEQDDGADRSG
jgi:excisionase family DNA binding protein